jgi:hypothetical protein
MMVKCPNCGKSVVVNGLGRKKLNILFKNVYDALQAYRDVGQAATSLGCSRGYIYKLCKDRGTTPRDVIEVKAG